MCSGQCREKYILEIIDFMKTDNAVHNFNVIEDACEELGSDNTHVCNE